MLQLAPKMQSRLPPQDLLRGIYPRIILGASNWARHLAGKLFAHWRGNMLWKFSDPPFLVAKEEDASVVYSTLPSLARLESAPCAFGCAHFRGTGCSVHAAPAQGAHGVSHDGTTACCILNEWRCQGRLPQLWLWTQPTESSTP